MGQGFSAKSWGGDLRDETCTAIQNYLDRGIQSGKSLGDKDLRQGWLWCVPGSESKLAWAEWLICPLCSIPQWLILACFLNICDSKPGVLLALSKVLKTVVGSRRSDWLPELYQLLQRYVHEHGSLRCLGKCDMYRGRKLIESLVFFFLKLRDAFQ